jgi:hypothetical protein
MTHLISRQIALMILLASSLVVVLLVLASGLSVDISAVYSQAAPLALVCAAAFTFLIFNPFDAES